MPYVWQEEQETVMTDFFSTQLVFRGDCLERMKEMEPCSIDCILTDPPYGLHFMGKEWDHGIPGVEFWKAAKRVCKPGAMMLAFGGTRTYHRLACVIEAAGWEIRDCMMWIYGQGFPKNYAIGKKLGNEWDGYGTALKPAYEPIIVAIKPLDGTFANNAEKWGVAGINVDGCRVETTDKYTYPVGPGGNGFHGGVGRGPDDSRLQPTTSHPKGRWPANVILDEEAGDMLGEPKRFFYCAKASSAERNKGLEGMEKKSAFDTESGTMGRKMGSRSTPRENTHPTVKPLKLLEYLLKLIMPPFDDAVVLDPFVGSGSTLVAAKNLGFNAVGIEISDEYADIAEKRIA